MSEIKTFPFDKDKFEQIKSYKFGRNWPVVYVIEDGKEIYIGETTSVYSRSRQHYENPDRAKLSKIHIITDDEYNKSATLDIESLLIQYISAEGTFKIQNRNDGLRNHNYFDKEKYIAKFESTWERLKEMSLVKKDLVQIKNSDLFKYSPYKALTEDQLVVVKSISKNLEANKEKTYIINGKPGTGKTILAVYLIKYLKENEKTKHLNVALVVPMTSLRKTIRKVFSKVAGLKSNMVVGPNEVVNKNYDILIVDEAHRLKQRKNITNYRSFDITNKELGFDNSGTELDWIMKSSKQQIFFYDKNQTIRPTDVRPDKFNKLDAIHYDLVSQQRISAGEEYINFIDDLFDLKDLKKYTFPDYDFQIYDDIHKMVKDIKSRDVEMKLCRMVAGYAWPWNSKKNKNDHDIEIDGLKMFWNSTNQDWVNSKNAINEVGCIHTVQGYDLNYIGVIIGPEISYDEENRKLIVNPDNYLDANGWKGINDPDELERYIINIYKTLLTRGIKGAYVYIVDRKLAKYFRDNIKLNRQISNTGLKEKIVSPYAIEMVSVPLLGMAPCGAPFNAEENTEEMILVPKSKIQRDITYFILRATGDSMNKVGINDGDLVLCKQKLTAHENDKVVALIDDSVTIKEFHRDGEQIILRPRSTNPEHQDIIPDEEVQVQGIVLEVIKRNSN